MHSIPIIDITDLGSGDHAARRSVAAHVGSACREVGFFVITGHGVTSAAIDDTFAASAAFFAQSGEAKRAMAIGRLGHNRGYVGPGIEALDEKSGADHKEAFNLIWTDGLTRPANVWPDLPGFRATLQALLRRAAGGRTQTACGLCVGPGPRRGLLLRQDRSSSGNLAPAALSRAARGCTGGRQIGAGAHTDYGNVTLLATDGVAGLQVRQRDGTWVDAPALSGTFICNIGDCLMRWTNDIYVSTPHRVLTPTAERYSIAMFVDPNPDAIVDAIPSCVPQGESPRHAPISARDYLQQRFASTYGTRSN